MKKALCVFLALAMCLTLIACGKSEDPANGKYAILIDMLECERYDDAITFIQALSGGTASAPTKETNQETEEATTKETTQETVETTTKVEEPQISATAATAAHESEPQPTQANTNVDMCADDQMILNAVQQKLNSSEFAEWQNLYNQFTGNKPRSSEISKVIYYTIDVFWGEAYECYLVNISADVAWFDKDGQSGTVGNSFGLLIDVKTGTVYDSITTNAGNDQHDTRTDFGKATYMLWLFNDIVNDVFTGNYANDSEVVTEYSASEISALNAALRK